MAYRFAGKSRLFVPGETGRFPLSRSKIELFVECPRCFYLDRVEGISRPSIPAFLLNSAVDELLKREFDAYRSRKEAHPLLLRHGINAGLFEHPELEKWRNAFAGVRFTDPSTDLEVFGAVDDVWINPAGELYVVDYKSTSKDGTITLEDRWKAAYKRQVEIYRWLLEHNGFTVSSKAYFLYANASRDRAAFEGRLEFDLSVLEHEGSSAWIDGILKEIRSTLERRELPAAQGGCEYCAYALARQGLEADEEPTIEM